MESILFFDAGPIISLIMSRLIWTLPELKKQFNGKFYITPAVKYELVDRPITVHRFQFEALQVTKLINDGVLEIYHKVPKKRAAHLIILANSTFQINGKNVDLLQAGEVESVACAVETNSAVVMDERTLRLLIEDPQNMAALLKHRFNQEVHVNTDNLPLLKEELQAVSIIRSIELAAIAYHLGFLNSYLPKQRGGKEILIDSILWATKYNGCAVTEEEIEEIKGELLS